MQNADWLSIFDPNLIYRSPLIPCVPMSTICDIDTPVNKYNRNNACSQYTPGWKQAVYQDINTYMYAFTKACYESDETPAPKFVWEYWKKVAACRIYTATINATMNRISRVCQARDVDEGEHKIWAYQDREKGFDFLTLNRTVDLQKGRIHLFSLRIHITNRLKLVTSAGELQSGWCLRP